MTIKKTQNYITKPMSATQIINTACKLYLSNFGILYLSSLITTFYSFCLFHFITIDKTMPVIVSFLNLIINHPIIIMITLSLSIYLIITINTIPYDIFINQKPLHKNWWFKNYKNLTFKTASLISMVLIIKIIFITFINGLIYAFLTFIASIIANVYIVQETIFYISLTIWCIFSFVYFIFYIGQIGICLLQPTILCNEKINFLQLPLKAFKIATQNIIKYYIFIFLLTSLCGALWINLYLTCNAILTLLDFVATHSILYYVDIIMFVFIIAFVAPIITGSITVYYYNHKAITEGYDLKIALEREKKETT